MPLSLMGRLVRLVVHAIDGNPDLPPFQRVLDRIQQQVDDGLLQSRQVAVDAQGPIREQLDLDLLAAVEQRAHDVHRLPDDLHHVHGLLAQVDPAARDARDVEQVIDDAAQVPGLPVDQAHRACGPRRIAPGGVDHLHCVGDGGKRVSQFMAEHRQELILETVRLAQLFGPGRNALLQRFD